MKKPFRIILCILGGIFFFAFTLVLFAAYSSITDGASFTEVLTSEDNLFFCFFLRYFYGL